MNNKKKIIFTVLFIAAAALFSCASNNDEAKSTETQPETKQIKAQYLSEEPEIAQILPDGEYIFYTVNSTAAGSIAGEALQDVSEGKKTSSVTARPELGYKFIKWSDGITEASRSDDMAEGGNIITAVFDYDILELPVVLINTATGSDVKSKTEYINADIAMFETGTQSVFWSAEIRGRGNNTWTYPKKSYKIKFTNKQNPFGLGNGKNRIWVLLANQCDQTLLRNHFAFELAKSFDKIAFAPSSKSVEVYLNGEYRGVYLLAEEIKVAKSRVNIPEDENEADTGYLIELSAYSTGDWIFRVGPRQYQVRSDLSSDAKTAGRQFEFITNYMKICWDAVKSGKREEIEKYINLDSYIDTYLVEEITKNLDLGWDSYYLHKNKGGKLVLGPLWDFDLSFGNSNESCEYYTDIYAGIDSGNNLGNPWYYEASKLQWFRELVVLRWDEVYESAVSKLPGQILAEGKRGFNAYSRNFIKWQIFGTRQNRETGFITSLKNYTEHYEYFSEWIGNRINWLNEYYHTDEYKNGHFIKKKGSGALIRPNESGSNTEGCIIGNEKTKKLLAELKPFDGTITLESAGAEGFENEGPENIFDGNPKTKYCYQIDNSIENEIVFTLSQTFTAKAYALCTANDTAEYSERNPDKWTLYGRSTKNGNWVEIDSADDGENQLEAANFALFGFTIDNPASYKYYKIKLVNNGTAQLSEIILFG